MSAVFSPDRLYRYTLTRTIPNKTTGHVVFLMLNPSTADEEKNDPTIRRCIGFASRWHANLLTVVNLFAWRSSDPRVLATVEDPIGPDNDRHIRDVCSQAGIIICAWSSYGELHKRGTRVRGMLQRDGRKLSVLKLSKKGFPCHPLYLPNDTLPKIW